VVDVDIGLRVVRGVAENEKRHGVQNLCRFFLGISGGWGGCAFPTLFGVITIDLTEAFPLACPTCSGDIRLIAFIIDPGPVRKILEHVGEPVEPPARGPPTEWTELPVIDIHSL
jgi:hypothetical protein